MACRYLAHSKISSQFTPQIVIVFQDVVLNGAEGRMRLAVLILRYVHHLLMFLQQPQNINLSMTGGSCLSIG